MPANAEPVRNTCSPIYCSEQIPIPVDLPDILKAFSKAAIRERPKDLHLWSAEYFSRLSKIRSRPVDYQLTYGSLEMLYNKLSSECRDINGSVDRRRLTFICEELGMTLGEINDIIRLANWTDKAPWLKFWALAVASAKGDLIASLETCASIVATSGSVPVGPIIEVLRFLASMDPAFTEEKVTQSCRNLMNFSDGSNIPLADVTKSIVQ